MTADVRRTLNDARGDGKKPNLGCSKGPIPDPPGLKDAEEAISV